MNRRLSAEGARGFQLHLLDVGDGDLHLDARFDADAGDLFDNLRRRVQVDHALVDAHFETIPSVGTLTARRLARGDAQGLRGQTDGSLDLEALVLRTLDEVRADCEAMGACSTVCTTAVHLALAVAPRILKTRHQSLPLTTRAPTDTHAARCVAHNTREQHTAP
jgi:hypothetical protein